MHFNTHKLSTNTIILYTEVDESLVKVEFFEVFHFPILIILKNIFINGYDQFFCNFQLVIGLLKCKFSAIVI